MLGGIAAEFTRVFGVQEIACQMGSSRLRAAVCWNSHTLSQGQPLQRSCFSQHMLK